MNNQRNLIRKSSLFLFLFLSSFAFLKAQTNYEVININLDDMKAWLQNAPLEGTEEAKSRVIVVELPTLGGQTLDVRVVESPILEPSLAAQFPEIKTYLFEGIEDKTINGRFTLSPRGLEGLIYRVDKKIYFEPMEIGSSQHKVYDYDDAPSKVHADGQDDALQHGYVNGQHDHGDGKVHDHNDVPEFMMMSNLMIGAQRREFSTHIIADGEYSAAVGGAAPTNATVLAAITSAINTINAIYEREVAVRLTPLNTTIFLDANTDIFPNACTGSGKADEAGLTFNNLVMNGTIALASFDVGHVFSGRGSGGSGYVGVICNNNTQTCSGANNILLKGGGGSGVSNPQGASWIELVAHELGHQFNASHSWNGTTDNCSAGQFGSNSAYEPGSGTTLMSYSGICEPQNVPNAGSNNDYFHITSINEIQTHITDTNDGGSCVTNVATGNNPPTVTANSCGTTYNIPLQTPFELTGSGSDPDGDALTYTWEQFDLGTRQDPIQGPQTTTQPLFRSYPPTTSPTRSFPSAAIIASGNYNADQTAAALTLANWQGELLPEVARSIKMRLTVRDNKAGGGGVEYDEITINAVNSGGPFKVTSPDGGETLTAGNATTVTWNVSGTNAAPINCANVTIKLSIDGGLTFPINLGTSANDGSESITIPSNLPNSSTAKIRIECGTDCFKFFDISNANLSISNANCTAAASNICPAGAMTVAAGAAANLSLSNIFGNQVTAVPINVPAGSPTGSPAGHDGTGSNCTIFSNSFAFSTTEFLVDATGTYNLNLGTASIIATIFNTAGLNTATPCTGSTFVASNFDANSGSTSSLINNISLSECTSYTMVVWAPGGAFAGNATFTAGPGNLYLSGTAPANTGYTYVAVNTANNQIVAQSATSDFSGISANGTYNIYGVSYKNSGATPPANANPSAWIGQTIASIQAAECAVFSSNSKTLTITGGTAACAITAISTTNISACSFSGGASTFTADVTVTFANPPASGSLDLTGDGSATVAVGSLGSATSHTFTGVTFTADGSAIDLTATYSADAVCTFNNTNAGTAPAACPPTCAISNVALMGTAACNGNNAEFTVTFDVANGSGNYELINTSNSNAVIGTITGGATTGTTISITGSIANTTAGSININVRDAGDNTCIGTPMSVTIPTCPPPCTISNVALMGTAACNGSNAEFTVTFDVANGSGNYELINTSNSNAVIGTITGGATTGTTISITGSIANTTAGSININVRDAGDNTCIGTPMSVTIPTCPPPCAISNVALMGTAACNGSNAEFTVTFDVANGSGNYELINTSNSNAVIGTITGGATTGTTISITGSIANTTAGSININVRDAGDNTCIGTTMSVTIPTCPPPCAISNVALMGTAACNGNNAEFTVTFDVANGSGNYNLINASNSNAIIGSITGGATAGTAISISGNIPNSTAGMINVNVVDANDATCIGINQTVSIPTCPMCPSGLAGSTADNAGVVNSTCTTFGGTPSNGSFAAITTCPTGSTAEYSADNGTTWSTIVPTYNQTMAMTVLTRCNCDIDNTVSSMMGSVTSVPGTCPPCPTGLAASTADNAGVTNSTCTTVGGTPMGGSFTAITTCPTGSTAEYSSDNGTTWSATVPTYNQTMAMTVLTRCNCDMDNAVSSMMGSITSVPGTCPTAMCPTALAASTADNAGVTNSTCTTFGGTPSNGSFAAITTCPTGSTAEYSADNGTTWSTTVPTYNQTMAMTVLTRCNCDIDNTVSSMMGSVTSVPGTCPPCPTGLAASTADNAGVTNSTCTTVGGTPMGGSFTAITTCPTGSTAEYSSDNGTTWSATVPTYNQTMAMTVLTRCNCDIDNAVSSIMGSVTSVPGSCPSPPLPAVCINEIDPDQDGSDTMEFVEISGPPNTSLDGLVVVMFNGSDDASYAAYDLDGFSLDANGFFVLGNSAVAGAGITLPSNGLQNGADAVGIYVGDATDFPNDTPVTTTNLISAIVYGTNDSDDTGLLTGLGETTQYNDGTTTSISRSTDCGSTIVSQTASAGFTNLPPVCINEIDPDQAGNDTMEFVEISGPPNTSLDGLVVVMFNGSDDASYAAYDLDGFSLDANGFFVLGNSAVAGAGITLPSNGLQNGADAIGIYVGDATDFPNDTPVTTTNLISAIVYGTNDSDDTGLLTGLGETTQYNDGTTTSISRSTDCGTMIVSQIATAGASNVASVDCPGLAASTADQIGVTNSTCTVVGGTPMGGSFTAITTCPTGSVPQYSTDNGMTWDASLPMYNQTMAMTVLTRCNCVDDNTISSMTETVTTVPGVCPTCEADAGDLLPAGPIAICEGDDTPEFTASYAAADETDPNAGAGIPTMITLSEIRIDQPGGDDDEYFEICGPPGTDLSNLTLVVLGDNDGGVETAASLAGQNIPADGCLLVAENSFSLGTPDLITSLNFENSDNLTFLLVENFTGAFGDDLDSDDDGVLDTPVPWTSIVSEVALVETPGSGDAIYSTTTVGPDGNFVPANVVFINGTWQIGTFDPADAATIATPGSINSAPEFSYIWVVTQSGTTPFDVVTTAQGGFGAPYGATFSGLAPGDYCVHGVSFEGTYAEFQALGSDAATIVATAIANGDCFDVDPAQCIPLTVVPTLTINNIVTSACTGNTTSDTYTVTFEISGGQTPLTINGEDISALTSGSITGGTGTTADPFIFVSNPIQSNSIATPVMYNFMIADASTCPDPVAISGFQDCDPCDGFADPDAIPGPFTVCAGTDVNITPTGGGKVAPVMPTDLFISEYIEGSSNNKCIEIYNGTAGSVNLSGYQLLIYFNGSSNVGQTINLTGTLASGDVYVVCNSNAASDFTDQADLLTGSMTFNGNDAVELVGNGTTLDVIGQIGDGTTFGSNTTLVRMSSISQGDSNGADAFDPTIEWNAFPSNTFTDLGMHTFTGSAPIPVMYNFFTGSCGGTLLGTGASYTLQMGDIPADGMPHTIFVSAVSTTPACESMCVSVDVTINPNPMTVSDATLFECDVDGEGTLTADFDLSLADAIISSDAGVTITYHATEMDALAGVNPLTSPYNVITTTTVFASVLNGATGCTAVAEVTLTVDDCPINITDPCVCQQNPTTPNINGNSTSLTNGQFGEEITITGPSNHTWFISSSDGIFQSNSPQPAAPPTPFLTGAGGFTLTEVPLGGGISDYVLTGIHIDAIGYEIVLENQNGVQRSIQRTICYYPEISWDMPTGDFCLFTDAFDVNATELNSATGDATFTLISNGNVIATSTGTTFNIDPMTLGFGNYQLNFSFDALTPTPNDITDPGCEEVLTAFFNIIETPSVLACNDDLNITLDNSCQAIINADMVLEGTYGCFDDYSLVITDINGNVVANNILNLSHVGAQLITNITHLPSGNICWGNITVEDKSAPSIDCMDMTIGCGDALPGAPTATDACGTVTVNMVSEMVVDNGCSGMFSEVITRVWEATDGSGNTATCTQVISREKATLADVVFPDNYTTDCANHEDDVYQNTNPLDTYTFTTNPALVGKLVSGEPTGAGCDNLIITKIDEIVEICVGSYKVLRHWTVTDWCEPVGGNLITATQVVKIEDTTGPSVDPVGSQTVGANSAGCGGVFVAPALGADDCSGVASATFSVDGTALVTGSSVPVGVHTIDYVVTDGCDNSTSGSYQLTVVDNFAPVAICDEHTVASIGSPTPGITGDGTATIPAATFDDGSYDNCGQVWFKVRRMTINGCNGLNGDDAPTPPFFFYPGYQEWFDDDVSFCCNDDVVMVIFRVYDVDPGDGPVEELRHNVGGDLYGHYNDCMVEVEVQDKLAPVIICPTDKTLNCDADVSVAAQGDADAFDNCSIVSVTNSDIDLTDDCGEGLILRTFVATDAAGNTNSCTQRITLINEDPFLIVDTECRTFGGIQGFDPNTNQPLYGNTNLDANGNPVGPNSRLDDVEWPCDIELTTCGLGLDPEDLATNYPNDHRPHISEDACGNIGVGHEDLTLPIQGDACIKILRKWTIIDWCQYTVGNALGNGIWEYVQVIKVVNSEAPIVNCQNSDSFIQNFEENCGATYVNLFIDANDDCTPQGDLTYYYEVENGNGTVIKTGTTNNASDAFNNGTYKITWTVADGCGNEQVCTHDFTVVDAKKPTPVCISGLASVIMPSSGTVTIWASDFESGSSFDNCTPYSGLQFSFSSDVTETSMQFDCSDVSGLNVPVEIWVTDAAGNQDFCVTYLDVQDPNGVCITTGLGALPTGIIQTEEGQEVELVNVDLMGSNEPTIVTSANGQFDFGQMPAGPTQYVITPEKNINPTNGVTTFDLVLISQHILGTNPIASPYKMIAADANNSETVTTFDIVVLRRLILQIDTQFSGTQQSWRFVDAAHTFASVTPADVFPFPETIIADANGGHNFIGVKIGDLNGSANVDELLGSSDTRTFDGDLIFQLEDKQVKADEEFTVDFRAKDFNNTLGYQFTLGFDNNKVEFVDLATNLEKMDEGNFGLTMLEEGIITTSWNSHEAVNVANDEAIFSLTFTATEAITISEVLNINSRYTVAEAYNGSDLYDVAIAFDGQVVNNNFKLYQNIPNPFTEATTIGFDLPEATEATLKVYDVSGKVLMIMKIDAVKGYNSVELNRARFSSTGVLYYQIETSNNTATMKMILVD